MKNLKLANAEMVLHEVKQGGIPEIVFEGKTYLVRRIFFYDAEGHEVGDTTLVKASTDALPHMKVKRRRKRKYNGENEISFIPLGKWLLDDTTETCLLVAPASLMNVLK